MISYSPFWNLAGGFVLLLIALSLTAEAKSSSLVPKSLLAWPALVVLLGVLTLIQGFWLYGFSVTALLGLILILCGVQAGMVNIRTAAPWPSGAVWLALIVAGIGFQFYPWFEQRVMGFLWMAIGLTKVLRERSAALESGTPVWVQLLYLQAVLLAASR